MATPAGSRGSGVGGPEAGARAKRRSRSVAERQRIVDAAMAPGASVAGVARASGVNANPVFKWIRRSREGWRDRRCASGRRIPSPPPLSLTAEDGARFVPVRLVAAGPAAPRVFSEQEPSSPRRDPSSPARSGVIDIRLPNGARVRVEAGVDRDVLRIVLATLSEARC
jgi:transposase